MIKSIEELRTELCEIFEALKTGQMEVRDAKERNNTAGKILGSIKVQLEYAALQKVTPDIPFLGPTND